MSARRSKDARVLLGREPERRAARHCISRNRARWDSPPVRPGWRPICHFCGLISPHPCLAGTSTLASSWVPRRQWSSAVGGPLNSQEDASWQRESSTTLCKTAMSPPLLVPQQTQGTGGLLPDDWRRHRAAAGRPEPLQRPAMKRARQSRVPMHRFGPGLAEGRSCQYFRCATLSEGAAHEAVACRRAALQWCTRPRLIGEVDTTLRRASPSMDPKAARARLPLGTPAHLQQLHAMDSATGDA